MIGRGVAVVGLGIVSPHGQSVDAFFDALCSGISAVAAFDERAVGAQCKFESDRYFTRQQLSGMDRVSQLAVAAATDAVLDAGYTSSLPSERTGVYCGTGFGGAGAVEEGYRRYFSQERLSPLTIIAAMANAPAAAVSLRESITGPVLTYSVACASSSIAIAAGAKDIAAGDVDIALVGGTEALLRPGMIAAWQAMQTLAPPRPNNPAASCRPFSASRAGLVLGEGAAFLVLERMDLALARGARIYAELAGTGLSCDASHLVKPLASGQIQAMQMALRASELDPAQIGYCNAHGTATIVGDVVEAESINAVWGAHIDCLRVSSTKSLHGHLLGAAGALEAVATVMALHRQVLPVNAHCEDPDPLCNLPLVTPGSLSSGPINAAMSNSFAFGGTNSVLVFKRTSVASSSTSPSIIE